MKISFTDVSVVAAVRCINRIVAEHGSKGHQTWELAVKLSERQAEFARLVATGDARVAAQYLERTEKS